MDGEFWVAMGVFAVVNAAVTYWATRRVPEEQRRAQWTTSLIVFLVVVTGLWAWDYFR